MQLWLDGLPLVGGLAGASVDTAGVVSEATGPLWRLSSLGTVQLAPEPEVLRRIRSGPGQPAGDCYRECTATLAGARLGLSYATMGGIGDHDHTPGGIVDAAPSQVLLPALWAPATSPTGYGTHLGIPAVSSAVLVDDPAQAEEARFFDAAALTAGGRRACEGSEASLVLTVCTSRHEVAAGTPVVVTVYGERYEPVGASRCDPLFTLDTSGGPQSFVSRSGTLITGRVVQVFDEPGIYTVIARAASRCAEPAPAGGTEPEYDHTATLTITVT